jgi:hypothetical protein
MAKKKTDLEAVAKPGRTKTVNGDPAVPAVKLDKVVEESPDLAPVAAEAADSDGLPPWHPTKRAFRTAEDTVFDGGGNPVHEGIEGAGGPSDDRSRTVVPRRA